MLDGRMGGRCGRTGGVKMVLGLRSWSILCVLTMMCSFSALLEAEFL